MENDATGTEPKKSAVPAQKVGQMEGPGPYDRVTRNQIAFIKGITGSCACDSCCQARDIANAASNYGSEY